MEKERHSKKHIAHGNLMCIFLKHPAQSAYDGGATASASKHSPTIPDTGKRPVQLPDAGSPPRRVAAPHGLQFRLLVLKEEEEEEANSKLNSLNQQTKYTEQSATYVPLRSTGTECKI